MYEELGLAIVRKAVALFGADAIGSGNKYSLVVITGNCR